jgi:2OG-Fe(II) oxygenase superfamily
MTALQKQTDDSVELLFQGKLEFPSHLGELRSKYQNAKPFKHIVIDHLFSDGVIEKVMREMPPLDRESWVCQSDEHLVKYNLRSAVSLGPNSAELTAFLHSAAFLYFLSELTGIWELLPDPYLQGAGFHLMPSGGKFDVHVDRNTAYETGLLRRLALIIYLNRAWPHEYGGQLELWDSSTSTCQASIDPLFNRMVIFEINDENLHGVANVRSPKDRSRNSFALYYHTALPNSGKGISPHTSIYAPGFYQVKKYGLRDLVRDVTPPIVIRGIHRIRARA